MAQRWRAEDPKGLGAETPLPRRRAAAPRTVTVAGCMDEEVRVVWDAVVWDAVVWNATPLSAADFISR